MLLIMSIKMVIGMAMNLILHGKENLHHVADDHQDTIGGAVATNLRTE